MRGKDLLRIYGSMMWSLGQSMKTPESQKIYVGSFWQQEYLVKDWISVFEEDTDLLFNDIKNLPQLSATRKIADATKRAKLLKAYALMINYLLDNLPTLCEATNEPLFKLLIELLIYSWSGETEV